MSQIVEPSDPFSQRSRLAHSVISDEYQLSPEVYENLFGEAFFESQVYRVWSQGNRPWALHCYGDPGCGKTTLAAIAVDRLRARGTNSVVSVFIEKDLNVGAANFLEDILVFIYNQLRSTGAEIDEHFVRYEEACRCGKSISKRTVLLRVAIRSLLDKHQHTFLVMDSYDRVGDDLQILLDRELADLRAYRLRVMLTRRVPAFKLPRVKNCDGDGCQAYNMKLYWSCNACSAPQRGFDLCYDCKAQKRTCVEHGEAHFEESYDHVSTDVSYPDNMEEYLMWELRRMSSLPQLGMLLEDAGTSQHIIKTISYDGNITIARLYLDNIFRDQCLDVVNKVDDRLPRNIIAMFDAGIGRIKQRPDREADIGLLAIAAVGERNQGIPLNSLADWMSDALSRLPHLAQAPPRSLEDVLRYTNGFIQERVSVSGGRCVTAYSVHFARYIKENYNDSLFWARNQLNIYRNSRTWTAITQIPPKLTSPPLISSPTTADGLLNASESAMGTPDYFIQSSRADASRWQPQALPRDSLPALPTKAELEVKKKKLGPLSRSHTTRSVQKIEFTTAVGSLEEEPEQLSYEKQSSSRSMHKPTSSRLCVMCQTQILGCGKLCGTYRRDYSSLSENTIYACIFCASMYKASLAVAKAGPKDPVHPDRWFYSWRIRTAARSRESQTSIVVAFHPGVYKECVEISTALESAMVDTSNAGNCGMASNEDESIWTGEDLHLKKDVSPPRSLSSSLMFHFLAEDELGQVAKEKDLGATTSVVNKAVGQQVKTWINQCNERHEKCIKTSRTHWVPTRLLDLKVGDGSSIRLVNTKDEGVEGPYVTLSHCWGLNHDFLTTTRSRELLHMTKGMKVADLKSTNFEQAICVARHLGIRYIWIDSLCIIQGSNGDFQAEGQLMHKVYRNSYCNLAAADAKDSHGGLFKQRQPSDVLPGRYGGDGSSSIFGTTAWRIVPDDLWDAELLGTCIYKRGWVFQERMLSPRILHFARNQIFWDCGAISACETLPSGLPLVLENTASTDRHWRGRLQESSSLAHAPLAGDNTDSLGGFWSSAVFSYTQCELTHQVDKTRAIWSIAKLLRDAWGDDYGVGTWALAVEEQLSWTVLDIKTSTRSAELQYQLPSWSWMSIQRAVSVPKRVLDDRCYRIKGHDEREIRFSIKGAAKPIFGRTPSDSVKKDVQLAWEKWQKGPTKRPQSSFGARANIIQERSQSAPVVPKQTIEAGIPSVKDGPAAVVDPRDLEPELISKSINIKAPITTGTLSFNDQTGVYDLLINPYHDSGLGKIVASNEVGLVGAADSPALADSRILLTAYPDTTPSSFDLAPDLSHFIILKAKSHTVQSASYGFKEQEYNSDKTPERTISYSGAGIIITPTVDYLRQHNYFAPDITHLEKKIASLEEDGEIENAKRNLEDLKAWMEDSEREGHWRRTGMVEFKDWSEKDWERVMGKEIWDVMRAQSSPQEENKPEALYPIGWGTEFWLD